jgi:hypothetical protein
MATDVLYRRGKLDDRRQIYSGDLLPAFIDGACCIAEHNLVVWRRIGTLNKGSWRLCDRPRKIGGGFFRVIYYFTRPFDIPRSITQRDRFPPPIVKLVATKCCGFNLMLTAFQTKILVVACQASILSTCC